MKSTKTSQKSEHWEIGQAEMKSHAKNTWELKRHQRVDVGVGITDLTPVSEPVIDAEHTAVVGSGCPCVLKQALIAWTVLPTYAALATHHSHFLKDDITLHSSSLPNRVT